MPVTSQTYTLNHRWNTERYAHYQNRKTGLIVVLINSRSLFNPGQGTEVRYNDTDWKQKVARGENASHPYRLVTYKDVKAPLIDVGTRYNASTTLEIDTVYRDNTYYVPLFQSADVALYDQALARFKSKLSGNLDGAKLLIPTAELRELRSTITGAAELSQSFLISLLQARKTMGRSLYSFFQKSWLSYSFAISPMINDIQGALEAVDSFLDVPKASHRVRGARNRTWISSHKLAYYNNANANVKIDKIAKVTHSLKYTFDSAIDYNLITGNNYGLKEHLGFTNVVQQLPSLGWELFPFSWVGDYFGTIGAYLEDTFELPPGSLKYLTNTRVYTANVELDAIVTPLKGSFTRYNVRKGSYTFVDVQRTVLQSLPHRALRFKTVDEMGLNAVNKLLNLTSLIRIH